MKIYFLKQSLLFQLFDDYWLSLCLSGMDVELQMLDNIFGFIWFLMDFQYINDNIIWTLKACLKSALFASDFGIKRG